jgi:hypothetical protein
VDVYDTFEKLPVSVPLTGMGGIESFIEFHFFVASASFGRMAAVSQMGGNNDICEDTGGYEYGAHSRLGSAFR